ncbi:4'-phosphopantetheinyl transferase superfamily protein [Erwinia tracheiphila]|uniref:4'-phosphopantetheinyl transferase family protein n=1 Tax=Erwinia tracheiphila TaxID=65700 RepID=UPI000683F49A|nr:4'-phosphopantetheinyl transferase superfamily protein [Erwinia tracheiphila]UIA95208.1 4'-phosphopantetheinyl transferase superfamily protein [Erwinia tracheiphila]
MLSIDIVTSPLAGNASFNLIDNIAMLAPSGQPDVLMMLASYNLLTYSEKLFSDLSVPFPAHLRQAVKKRCAEYLASRVCTRYALGLLGVKNFILQNDQDRVPVWPEGMVGALSHTDGFISLLVGNSSCGKLHGIDCEHIIQQERVDALRETIITADENHILQQGGLYGGVALTVAFSIKESLYKALFPHTRQFMDFKTAEITACSRDTNLISLQLTRPLSARFPTGRNFTGYFNIQDGRVLTWLIASLR